MTNARLTPAEINAALAIGDGWTTWKRGTRTVWSPPHDPLPFSNASNKTHLRWQRDPPDSCGEWQHAGPLLVELVAKVNHFNAWMRVCAQVLKNPTAKLTDSISRAELARREREG